MKAQTSLLAAAMQTPEKLQSDKERIMLALVSAPRGLTRRQLAERTGIKINTVNGRVADLQKEGLAYIIGTTIEDGAAVGIVAAKRPERLF